MPLQRRLFVGWNERPQLDPLLDGITSSTCWTRIVTSALPHPPCLTGLAVSPLSDSVLLLEKLLRRATVSERERERERETKSERGAPKWTHVHKTGPRVCSIHIIHITYTYMYIYIYIYICVQTCMCIYIYIYISLSLSLALSLPLSIEQSEGALTLHETTSPCVQRYTHIHANLLMWILAPAHQAGLNRTDHPEHFEAMQNILSGAVASGCFSRQPRRS